MHTILNRRGVPRSMCQISWTGLLDVHTKVGDRDFIHTASLRPRVGSLAAETWMHLIWRMMQSAQHGKSTPGAVGPSGLSVEAYHACICMLPFVVSGYEDLPSTAPLRRTTSCIILFLYLNTRLGTHIRKSSNSTGQVPYHWPCISADLLLPCLHDFNSGTASGFQYIPNNSTFARGYIASLFAAFNLLHAVLTLLRSYDDRFSMYILPTGMGWAFKKEC